MEEQKQHTVSDHSKHHQDPAPDHSQHDRTDHSMHNMESYATHSAHQGHVRQQEDHSMQYMHQGHTMSATPLELLGVSIAAHPLELIADKLNGSGTVSTVDAVARVGRRVIIAGIQQASHRTRTARGDMLFLSIEDLQGTLDAILFLEVYRQVKTAISSTKPFLLTGIMEMDTEHGEPFLRVEKAASLI